MSGALSKRQQARNERTLQELIKAVPGNNVCADCQARNPGMINHVVLFEDANCDYRMGELERECDPGRFIGASIVLPSQIREC
jgi:hypothetical protein